MPVELRKEDKSLGELFSELTSEVSLLFRQEMELAKLEMVQKLTEMAKNSGMMIVGIALGYAAFLALTAAAIFALALVTPLWLSALIIGLLVGIIGGILAFVGLKRLKQQSPVPEQTIETLKEDKRWLKSVK